MFKGLFCVDQKMLGRVGRGAPIPYLLLKKANKLPMHKRAFLSFEGYLCVDQNDCPQTLAREGQFQGEYVLHSSHRKGILIERGTFA